MANATQFIGSKISLISKSEIRYDGILYSLDVKESTISLAKVKSYGTEERPTERPSPPRDEVYDFIVFRGSDIKCIDVIEPPKQTTTSQDGINIPIDPAIVQVSQQNSRTRTSSFTRSSGQSASSRHPQQQQRSRQRSQQTQVENVLEGLLRRGPRQSDAETQVERSSRRNKTPLNEEGRRERGGRGQGRGGLRRDEREENGGFRGRRSYNFSPRGGWGGRGYFRRPQGILRAPQSAKVTFEHDFDFEKSHEELLTKMKEVKVEGEEVKKEETETTVLEGEEQENKDPDIFYRKDDFFDAISCEALLRAKGPMARPDWRKELKLNAETFGLSGQRRGFHRGGYYNNRGGYDGRWSYNRNGYGNRYDGRANF